MPSQFVTTRRVDFIDTDMAGIVHYANFYRFMEAAETEFFRSLGLSLVTRREDGSALGWPRVSCSCSFKSPAYFEDVLEIRILVLRKGVKSLTMQFQFWRGETHIATGKLKTAYCLFRPGQPITSLEIPPEFDHIQESPEANSADEL